MVACTKDLIHMINQCVNTMTYNQKYNYEYINLQNGSHSRGWSSAP